MAQTHNLNPPVPPDTAKPSRPDARIPMPNDFNSELVLGLVAAVGTDLRGVVTNLQDRLKQFGYHTEEIHVSKQIIPAKVWIGTLTFASSPTRTSTVSPSLER